MKAELRPQKEEWKTEKKAFHLSNSKTNYQKNQRAEEYQESEKVIFFS